MFQLLLRKFINQLLQEPHIWSSVSEMGSLTTVQQLVLDAVLSTDIITDSSCRKTFHLQQVSRPGQLYVKHFQPMEGSPLILQNWSSSPSPESRAS